MFFFMPVCTGILALDCPTFFLLLLLYFKCFLAVVKNKNCDRDQVSIRLLKRRTCAFDYHISHKSRSDILLHYLQKISDDCNFVPKKFPKKKTVRNL